jgi:hypothetical protein
VLHFVSIHLPTLQACPWVPCPLLRCLAIDTWCNKCPGLVRIQHLSPMDKFIRKVRSSSLQKYTPTRTDSIIYIPG